MAFVRTEEERPAGFVDPSTRYTPQQLEEFYQRALSFDNSLDETIDLYLHRKTAVTLSEILQSEKYKDKWWRFHQPVMPCGIVTFEGYLRNFDKWFNPGRLAWVALLVLSDIDTKFWREQQIAGFANELNRIGQLLKKYNTGDQFETITDVSTALDKYSNFINDVCAGKIVSAQDYQVGFETILEAEKRHRTNLSNVLIDLVTSYGYTPAQDLGDDLYEKLKEDAEGLYYFVTTSHGEFFIPKIFNQ